MSDHCSIDFRKVVDKASKMLKKLFDVGEDDVILKKILGEMEQKLERDAGTYTKLTRGGHPDADGVVTRMIQQDIDDAVVSYNAITTSRDIFQTQLKGATNIEDVTAAMQAQFSRIANSADLTRSRIHNIIDQQVEAVIGGANNANPKQVKEIKDLFYELVATDSEEALEKMLKKQGVVDTFEEIYRAKKNGHTFDVDGVADTNPLNLIAKMTAQIEKIIQEELMVRKPGYVWDQSTAFMTRFDPDIVVTKTRKTFTDDMYTKEGKYLFDIGESIEYKERIASKEITLEDAQKEFTDSLFDSLTDPRYEGSSLTTSTSTVSLFQSRKLNFTDEASEIHFYNTFVNKKEGLFKGSLKQQERQLMQLELRDLVGTNKERWLNEMKKSVDDHFKGQGKDVGFYQRLNKRWRTVERDFKAITGAKNAMTETQNDLYIASQLFFRSVQTTTSALRNFFYDNTFYSAFIESSLDPSKNMISGTLFGGIQRMGLITGSIIRSGLGSKKIARLQKIMDQTNVTSQVSNHTAWSRILNPTDSLFGEGGQKGFARMVRNMTNRLAEGVSKYTLADATFRAARQIEFLNASRMLHMASDTPQFRLFLKDYGMSFEDFKAIRDMSGTIDYEDLKIFDFERLLDDAPDDVINRMKGKGETAVMAKRRLTKNMYDVFVQLHDDLATRVTQRTGISVHVGHDSAIASMMHGFVLKYMGITSTQHQSFIRAGKRIAGEEGMGTGKWNVIPLDPRRYFHLSKQEQGPALILAALASIYAGGYLIQASKNILKGLEPPDPLNKHVIGKAFQNAAPLGVLGAAYNSLVHNDSPYGFPGTRQVAGVKNVGKGVIQGVMEGDWDKLKSAGVRHTQDFVPLSRLIIDRGSGGQNWLSNALGLEGHGEKIRKGIVEDEGTFGSSALLKFLGFKDK